MGCSLSRAAGKCIATVFCLAAMLAGKSAQAQNQETTIVVASALGVSKTIALADYTTGYFCAGSVGITLSQKGTAHTDAVYVRASTATIAGAASPSTPSSVKPVSDLQFSTTAPPAGCASGAWTSVGASTVSPPTTVLSGVGAGSYTVYFRVKVTFGTDEGGVTYTLPSLTFWVNLPSPPP